MYLLYRGSLHCRLHKSISTSHTRENHYDAHRSYHQYTADS